MKTQHYWTIVWMLLLSPLTSIWAQQLTASEVKRMEQQAKQVTIIRDNWGIAHVY